MSEHDVTQSSNPDVQALLVVITGLARRVEAQAAQLQALQAQFDSLPSQFVVPGPNGEAPAGTAVVNAGGGRGSYLADDREAMEGIASGTVVAGVRELRIDLTGNDERRVFVPTIRGDGINLEEGDPAEDMAAEREDDGQDDDIPF